MYEMKRAGRYGIGFIYPNTKTWSQEWSRKDTEKSLLEFCSRNRDTVQIISIQVKAALKEYKCGKLDGTIRFQMGNTGIHVQQHYWLYCDGSNVHDMRSQLYTQLELKSTEQFRRANLLKKHV